LANIVMEKELLIIKTHRLNVNYSRLITSDTNHNKEQRL